jgi:class 3 adenylate cyclase/tetratricopeptide (TPR) repeat protein
VICPSCGHENAEGARFCNECGAALRPSSAPREERKVVSIVFADLVGSTAAAEQSDPEDVRAVLAAHHARVRAHLERFGGTVEKFIGDAVVAVFGAPVVHEDDPERAVRAALAIRDEAREGEVQLRVAVNTGEALVNIDARPSEGEGMVAGDVVNTAARIQSAAPVNGVLVGEGTYRATAHVVEYRAIDAVQAKGKSQPVPVWEAVAVKQRFGSDVEQAPLVELIGREREVDALRSALARARQEREPQLVTMLGVPGIGKSRLIAELFSMVEADPDLIAWRQGRCLPYGEGVNYWALGEMAKAQAGILETDSADQTADKLSKSVRSLIRETTDADWVIGHLQPLVGLSIEASKSAGESRGETFAAWRRFFEAMGEQRPTVLIFEDLHWADDGLLDFVDDLVDRATGVPLMVLCSARPELLVRRPAWGGGKANATTLSLSALSDEQTTQLIGSHLRGAVLPVDLQEALLGRADGNPLFAEEFVRMLRDRGHLHLEDGEWQVTGNDVELPETVQGIIAARLDALTPDEKNVLQAASVVGKVFWLGSVAAMAGSSAVDTEERLHALERKELVRRDRRGSVAGETEYSVRHVLVRDVAYGQIPRARRADLHVRAARWIESLAEDRSEDRSEMRAHHYQAALDLMRAAGNDTSVVEPPARQAFREAAQRAYALGAVDSAMQYFSKARELWPAEDPEYARLLFDLGTAKFWALNEGVDELNEAASRLLAMGDVEGAAEAESKLGWLAWRRGSRDEARERGARSIHLIADLPDTRTTAAIRSYDWRLRLLQGDQPSLAEGERILAMNEALGTAEDILNSRITLATGRAILGSDVSDAVGELRRIAEDAVKANSHLAARAYVNLASLTAWLGDLPAAAEVNRAGLNVAQRFTSSSLLSWFHIGIVENDFYVGEWARAAEEAEAILARPRSEFYMDHALLGALASITAAQGDGDAAKGWLTTLVEQARGIGDPQVMHSAMGRASRLALEAGELDVAREYLSESIFALRDSIANLAPETAEAAIVAQALGRGSELLEVMAGAMGQTPWADASAAIVEERFEDAGDTLEGHGDLAHAALVRLVGAERAERRTPGLQKAISFYEGVKATAMLRRAEAIVRR